MEPTEIQLGERTYTIQEIPLRLSKAWREQLDAPLKDVLSLTATGELDFSDPQQAIGMVNQIRSYLTGSVEILTDLVLAWDGKLSDDQEYILDHAYPSQIMEAFTTILRYAYPFGQVVGVIQRLSRGQPNEQTIASSPSPSGDSGTMNSTPSR